MDSKAFIIPLVITPGPAAFGLKGFKTGLTGLVVCTFGIYTMVLAALGILDGLLAVCALMMGVGCALMVCFFVTG